MSNELTLQENNRTGLLLPVASPIDLIDSHKAMVNIINSALESGKDYGTIPGAGDKMNLLKPGAERLCGAYGLNPHFEVIDQEVDHGYENEYSITKWVTADDPGKAEKERLKAISQGRNKKIGDQWRWQIPVTEIGTAQGLYRFVIRCTLRRGDQVVGEGVGSCSSLESKYIRQPRDAENTILKMAKKRAYVDATLTTLGLSDRFTQDMEDIVANRSVYDGVPESSEPQRPAPREQRAHPADSTPTQRANALMFEKGWLIQADGKYTTRDDCKEGQKMFLGACKSKGVDWAATLIDAVTQGGCESFEDAFYFVEAGQAQGAQVAPEVIDAEIVKDLSGEVQEALVS